MVSEQNELEQDYLHNIDWKNIFVLQYFHESSWQSCVMEITYHTPHYHVIHIKGLYCKGIWCSHITQLMKYCVFIYCSSYANYVNVSKSDRRLVASLCSYQIFSLNSDQQNHIVCNFINTFSSVETCNTHEFNTVICVCGRE